MINLQLDQLSENCEEIILFIKYVIRLKTRPLILDLPNTFEEYFTNIIEKQSRTEWRKAKKNGYEFLKVNNVEPWNKDIIEIWDSQKERLDRSKTLNYFNTKCESILWKDKWPIQDYSVFTCPRHRLDFWLVVKDGKAVVECEVCRSGNFIMVHSFMGHLEHFRYGIMKFCLMELIKYYMEDKSIRYFSYGMTDSLLDQRKMFVKELGFEFINKDRVYTI